jgi:hypothetical protein
MENAQVLAATATSGSEPNQAQVLLLKVYTPSPVAMEPRSTLSPKDPLRRHLAYEIEGLDAS